MTRKQAGNELVKSEPKNEIVVYQPNETLRLEVQLRDESIWLSQQKIANLFGVQKAAISKHLKNIYESGELKEREQLFPKWKQSATRVDEKWFERLSPIILMLS